MTRGSQDRLRVWIDGQCFQSASRYRGIGRAIFETLTELKRDHHDLDLHLSLNAAHAKEAQTARRLLTPLLGADHIHVWEGVVDRPESQVGYGARQQASEAILAHHVRSIAPDIIWSASSFEGGHERFVSLTDPRPIGVPSLVTFYDAIPWRFPGRYLGDSVLRACYERHLNSVANYDLAMAISEFTADELRDIHPGQAVVTVSCGLSQDFLEQTQTALPRARSKQGGFELLYVGGIDWRKNVPAILEALAILKGRGRADLTLRLVGDQPKGDLDHLIAQARALGIEDQLRFTGFCSDAELVAAYRQCDIAIQPSIMEGFGLTALEAMRAGAPLIVARAGALPEVTGEAALLFDPYRPTELAAHIQTLIDDSELRKSLRAAGLERSKRFSWSETANRVANAIRRMARPVREPSRSIEQQRTRTVAALPKPVVREIGRDRLAAHLAASEVFDPSHTGRIFIDVTSTLYANHGTGIQRVVTRIAKEALAQFPEAQLVICDSDIGLEAAKMTPSGQLRTTKRLSRERIFPRANDVVLMLDSSWTWHKSIETVMTDARLRGARVISVMYDLVPVSLPAFCDDGMPVIFSNWLRAALRYSDGFMCISEATATALRDFLAGMDFPRPMPIGHWPLGADIGPATTSGAHDPDHFLCVATIEPRKGHADLIRAFEALWAAGEEVRLTLIGRPGWGTGALQDRIKAMAAQNSRLQWISDADDVRLARAYAEAGTLIAPSYAEGFGLPIVEGRRQGCGVIARDIDVFREIAPDGTAFYNDIETLQAAILKARKKTPLSDTTPEMTGWPDSAAALMSALRAREFSHDYHPQTHDRFAAGIDIGRERMAGEIARDPAAIALRVLPIELDSPHKGHHRFAIEVQNNGNDIFFSKGRLTGEDCVHLSFLTYDHDDKLRDIQANRTKIPFGLGVGQRAILPVDVPSSIVENPVIAVDFTLVQEDRGWWDGGARLNREDFPAIMANLMTTAKAERETE